MASAWRRRHFRSTRPRDSPIRTASRTFILQWEEIHHGRELISDARGAVGARHAARGVGKCYKAEPSEDKDGKKTDLLDLLEDDGTPVAIFVSRDHVEQCNE